MFVSRGLCSLGVVLALSVSLGDRAFAQGEDAPTNPAVQECARAYEDSQEQRSAGALSSARLEFERCRRDDCPTFIRRDCARWFNELEAEQPSVIFSAKRGTRELSNVRVSTAGRVLLERLNSQAIELDPGEYDFRFEASDGSVIVQHARIQTGNKDRLVQVEFASPAPAPTAAARPSGFTKTATTREPSEKRATATSSSGPGVLPWVLLGVGAASVATGAGLAVWGRSNELDLRHSCSPNCTDAQVEPVRAKYLASNISFGVGLVSLSAAAYLFLSRPSSEPTATGTLPVTVVASPSSIQASYGARF